MITIRNETELYEALDRFRGGLEEEVEFEGYPVFEITLRGERFDGGVPTRIMPALLDLQREIDKVAAGLVGRRRPDQEMLRRTEIIVRTEPGSTQFIAELAPVFNALAGNMTGGQTMIVLLVTVGVVGSGWFWKVYHNRRLEEHRIDAGVELSRLENQRLETVSNLSRGNQILAEFLADDDQTRSQIYRRMDKGDELQVGGEALVDGETAKQLARNPRAEPVQDRLDGVYLILSVDSGSVQDGVRARVRNTETAEELTVAIPGGTLSEDALRDMQNGEWDKRPLEMRINVTRLRGRITKATLVQAGLRSAKD